MEIETAINETIPDVSPEKSIDESADKEEEESEEKMEDESSKSEKRPIEAPNGSTATPVRKPLQGIVVQFPEMFSLKRDAHFLEKLDGASDIKLQKVAYIECDSAEAATALQAKLNDAEINGKKMTATRLDLTEKNVLYCNGIRKEDTDEHLRETFPEIQEIKRESYNTFILFGSEAQAKAARQIIQRDGVNGHKVICEFDNSGKNRFKPEEEPSPKKAKTDDEEDKEEASEEKEAEEEAEGEEAQDESA